MPKKKNEPNKSDFVRSQPNELTAAEVIAKAKEAGMSITSALVYKVRSTRAAKPSKGHAAPAAAAAHEGAAKADGKMTSSDFIRSQPASRTAKEIAEEGAKQGYVFKTGLVYEVRRAQKKKGAIVATGARRGRPPGSKNKAKAGHAAPAHAAAHAPAHAFSKAEASSNRHAFRRLLIRLGLDTAEALYAEVHRELSSIEQGK